MRALAAIAAAVLIAGSLAAQEPATGSAEPEAAPARAEGTTSDARQIIEGLMPPRDVWDVLLDPLLVILGGVVTGMVGLIVGWRLFRQEREEKKRTIAAVLVAELNHVLTMIDMSLEAVKSSSDVRNPDSVDRRAVIENLSRIQRFDRAYQAVLPQIGVLGADNANRIINLYFGLELLVADAHSVENVMDTKNLSQFLRCIDHANEVRERTDKLGQSLTQQFLTGEQITEEIEGARDEGRSAGPSS